LPEVKHEEFTKKKVCKKYLDIEQIGERQVDFRVQNDGFSSFFVSLVI